MLWVGSLALEGYLVLGLRKCITLDCLDEMT